MPVDDLWYRRDPETGKRVPSQRHGRGKRYRARWADDAGKTRTELFDRKSDAEARAEKMRTDVRRGDYIDNRAGRVTVAEYGKQWRALQLHRESTAELVERAFTLHIDPILGSLQLGKVQPATLQAWVKDRAQVLAPSTLKVAYGYLVTMFGAAVRNRVIGRSPCVDVRLPEIPDPERYVPSPEQIRALADALPERYRAIPYIAAGCGLRGGEIFGLELEHVNFLGREVAVRQQLKVVAGRKPFLAPPKTKTSRRTVELPSIVGGRLAVHLETPPEPVELVDETDPRRPVTREALLTFTNANGEPIHRASWSHVWRPAVQAAKLPEGFGLHGLRHYYATALIHAGASVKTVQLALGHSSPTVTLDTYVHEWPDVIDRTRAILDAALSGSSRAEAAQ